MVLVIADRYPARVCDRKPFCSCNEDRKCTMCLGSGSRGLIWCLEAYRNQVVQR